MFQINKLQINEGKLHFLFSAETGNDPIEVCFGLRDNERWGLLERNQEILIVPEKDTHNYEVDVNLYDIIDQYPKLAGKKNVIDILVKHQSNYHRLYITEEVAEYINNQKTVNLSPLLNLKYYVINSETMGIQLQAKNVKSILKKLQLNGDKVNFQLATLLNNEPSDLSPHRLFVKQRSVSSTTQTYHEWHSIGEDGTNSFTLSANDLIGFSLDEKEIFDLFLEYKYHNFSIQVPLSVGEIQLGVKRWCKLFEIFDVSLLKGVTGNLSIRTIRKELSVTVVDIALDIGYLTLKSDNQFSTSNPLKLQVRSYSPGMKSKDTIVLYEKPITLDPNQKHFMVSINLEELFKDFSSNYKRTFKVFFESDNQLYKIIRSDFQKTVYIHNTSIRCSFDDTLILETGLVDTKPVPVAIMGSCFSRNSFNSAEYFNPDYKKDFKVAYSYFWPSIISLVSDQLPYDPSWFEDVSDEKYHELEWEFLKNWDKALRDSGAEYLLLDFFVDAMHGVLKVGPDQFLTRNLYTRKTGYYHTKLLKEAKSVDCFQSGYFELWSRSFDLFIERIKDIIPEEKIVLNLSLLTDRFYDDTGGITTFFDSKHITKSRFIHVNNVWTKMNNYFLTKLPKAKVIDMTNYGYIGQFDAPSDLVTLGPHHYESAFYRSIIAEFNKIVRIDSRLAQKGKIEAK